MSRGIPWQNIIVAVPEQSLNAARTLQVMNTTPQPFLPGKVALYQDGAFLGFTDIAFIAEGETFSLFLSVADHLKLSRKMDRKRSSLVRRRRNKMQVAFIVTVENLSSEATEVALADRIPVSENKEIRIDHVKITGRVKPDSHGLLRWTLKLKPKETRHFRIAYRVEYPPELVLETRRRRQRRRHAQKMMRHRRRSRRRAPAQAQSAASPVARQKYKIADQLADLEARL